MSIRRDNRLAQSTLILGLALGIWLGLASVPASAKVTHSFISSFNGVDAPEGPFGIPVVTDSIDQTSGDVYVTESNVFGLGKGVIDKFDENGVYAGVQIAGAETPQGSFALTVSSGVAVDNSLGINGGDVYIADTEHGVVDRFSSTGAYICQITGGATPSASECNGPGGSETPNGSIAPTGVAVDSAGDIYVADTAHAVVDKFGPAGNYIYQIVDSHLTTELATIALDSSGNLYVTNFGLSIEPEADNIVKFDAAGTFMSVFDRNSPRGVGVDPATDNVYASNTTEGNFITEYDSAGNQVGIFGEAQNEGGSFGLAVRGSTGKVYVAELNFGGGLIGIFGPGITVPNVTTGAATNVQETSVTFNGHVDPDTAHGGGEVTECEFEYGTSTSYGQSAPCVPAAPIAGATDVSANVTVVPSTTYHFRLKAANASGTNEGMDESFTTSGPPSVKDGNTTAIVTSAIVRATIDPFGHDTTCQVRYVEEADFKSSGYANATSLPCAPPDLGPGFGDRDVSAALTGLLVGTTYHFQFVAKNQAATTTSSDSTFATFGINSFAFEDLNREGKPETQAGAHPYKLVTTFGLNNTRQESGQFATDANLKDVETELPSGIIGNVNATPKCTRSELTNHQCSGASQVGVLHLLFDTDTSKDPDFPGLEGEVNITGLYNLVPPPGVPAEFGARIGSRLTVYIDANIRAGGDYGITAHVLNASTAAGVTGTGVEIWGVPADPSHDAARLCPDKEEGKQESGPCSAGVASQPFLTNPTLCAGPQTATLRVDSWQDPGAFVSASSTLPAFTGCDRLNFPPSITVLPDTSASDTPSGVSVNLRVPQNNEAPEALATPSLKDATVTLPAGVTLNPAAANGLQACSLAQIGLESSSEPTCPDTSKVGSVEIETPLLVDRLMGSVYLARQNNNPFGSLLALYVTAQADGALIKVAGHVEANPLTGQLKTTFANNPQLPFSDFRLHFFGGPRAPLATPSSCGTYTTVSSLTPWSAPGSGLPATPSFSFQITTGPGGVPCAPQGFAPGFTAGTTSNQAGGFSPFTLTMSRNDGEQNLGTIFTKMPPGVVGMLSKVPLCGESQANEGACPAASLIGHVTVGVGAGPYPLQTPEPGKPEDPVYLTGPYKGAPFGLSVVVPAEAGPFNLDENGRPVVVRAAISIDPTTAQVTVMSDPLPQMLQGIPLDVRLVNVTIDRPEFIVNSTSCERTRIVGKLTSALGAMVSLSSPFQVTNCAALGFKPRFSVSTSGKTSRANGASLHVKLAYPKSPVGSQANIAKVKVDLPKLLPSNLKTLQHACPAATFNQNPAACSSESRIGQANATTPLLPVSLTGPAYFVSHGGLAFPELVIVLSGYGVTVQLHAETFINPKTNITSSTFRTIPDVPVGTFELTLPQGKFSALSAPSDLCKTKLKMPTTFTAQNGATIKQNTPISVTGCAKKKLKKTPGRSKHHKQKK